MNCLALTLRLTFIAVLLLFCTELLLRTFVLSPSRQTFDPELGFVYLPNAEIFHTGEGHARNKLNELGLNAASVDTFKGERSVLILGDSYTESLQVPREHNFVSLAAAETGHRLLNAGRSGLGPAHYPTVLARLTAVANPDLTIICLTQGDIADALSTPKQVTQNRETGEIEAISVQANANNRIRKYAEPIIHHSAFATLIMRRAALFASGIVWPWAAQAAPIASPINPRQKELRFLFGQLADNGPLRLIYIPTLEYGPGGNTRETEASKRDRLIFAEIADKAGLPLHDAGPAMRATYAQDRYPLTGFDNSHLGAGHLNPQGHKAVAKVLAKALRDAGL